MIFICMRECSEGCARASLVVSLSLSRSLALRRSSTRCNYMSRQLLMRCTMNIERLSLL